ncbi:hypothetical protein AgCh_004167 [Apium graveolens]
MTKKSRHKEIPQEGKNKGNDEEEENLANEYWVLYPYRASKAKSSETELVLQSYNGFIIEDAMKLDFSTTKNKAEYETLIVILGLAGTLRVMNLKVCFDSRLVIFQVNGESEVRDEIKA